MSVNLDNFNEDEWGPWIEISPRLSFSEGDIFILSTYGKNGNLIYKVISINPNGPIQLQHYYVHSKTWHGGHGWDTNHINSYVRFPKSNVIKDGRLTCPPNCKCHQP